jgi:hypothetical protein
LKPAIWKSDDGPGGETFGAIHVAGDGRRWFYPTDRCGNLVGTRGYLIEGSQVEVYEDVDDLWFVEQMMIQVEEMIDLHKGGDDFNGYPPVLLLQYALNRAVARVKEFSRYRQPETSTKGGSSD